ncbi:Myosin-binding protein 2 [Linum perenne]
MMCQEVESWTFNGLVAAFLDLAIAYLFLSASAFVYFASKFLALFGFSMPCSCNDKSGNCWPRFIVDHPCHSISNVQSSVRRRLPFDLLHDKEIRDEVATLELESSCNLLPESNNNNIPMEEMLEEGFGTVSKGEPVKKVKCSHRRKRAVEDGTMPPQVPAYYSSAEIPPLPPPNGSKVVNKVTQGKMIHICYILVVLDDAGSSADTSLPVGLSEQIESTERYDEGKQTAKDGYPSDDLKSNNDVSADDERNALRVLEQALEEERTARLALCQELEQERNAAASAADEAMAMIVRLQEEKASVEMAARQYQRMIDEKSAYDYEEMNILEEMLLKRERETHFLENELEAYKMMIFGNEQLDSGVPDIETMLGNGASFSQYSSEDPSLPRQRVVEKQDAQSGDPGNQVKSTLASTNLGFKEGQGSSSSKNIGEELKKSSVVREENRAFDHKEHLETASLAMYTREATNEKKITGKSQDIASGVGPFVQDVHIIEDKTKPSNEVAGKGSEKLSFYPAFSISRTGDNQAFSRLEAENSFNKGSSDATSGLPPIGSSRSRPQSIKRRNSMSAADFERSKIDYEVGWLRERRRIVKEGREKLNIPTGAKGKDKVQLQNMEKIVGKLREIQQLSEPGKAVRQALLTPPPLSGRVMSRRRRGQSVTLQTQRST